MMLKRSSQSDIKNSGNLQQQQQSYGKRLTLASSLVCIEDPDEIISADPFDDAIEVMSKKACGNRSQKDKKAIIRVLQQCHFIMKLKKHNKNLLNLVAGCVELEHFSKGKAVFMAGDRPDKLYIILRGKVSVLIPKSKAELSAAASSLQLIESNYHQESSHHHQQNTMDSSHRKQTDHSNSSEPFPTISQSGHSMQSNNRKKRLPVENEISHHDEVLFSQLGLYRQEIHNWRQFFQQSDDDGFQLKYNHIKFLTDNEVFGEFGLMIRKQRSASILAVQDTVLMSISKQQYEDFISEIQNIKIEQQKKYFCGCLMLNDEKLKQDSLDNIVLEFSTKLKLKQGWRIFSEGDLADSIFLIKHGEIQLFALKSNFDKSAMNTSGTNSSSSSSLDPSASTTTSTITSSNQHSILPKAHSKKQSEIGFGILSARELVGLEDLLFGIKHRSYSARCLTDTTVFMMPKSQLIRFLYEEPCFKSSLKSLANAKRQFHIDRINSIIKNRNIISVSQSNIRPLSSSSSNQYNNQLTLSPQKDSSNRGQQQRLISHMFPRTPNSFYSTQTTSSSSQQQQSTHYNFPSHHLSATISPTYASTPRMHDPAPPQQETYPSRQHTAYKNESPPSSSTSVTAIKPKRQMHHTSILLDQLQDQLQVINEVLPTEKGNNSRLTKVPESQTLVGSEKNIVGVQKSTMMMMGEEVAVKRNSVQENQFWFDRNIFVQMHKKIDFLILEKDPIHIKKVRQTFKGNIDTSKYGSLNKKIQRIVTTKPKLISNSSSNIGFAHISSIPNEHSLPLWSNGQPAGYEGKSHLSNSKSTHSLMRESDKFFFLNNNAATSKGRMLSKDQSRDQKESSIEGQNQVSMSIGSSNLSSHRIQSSSQSGVSQKALSSLFKTSTFSAKPNAQIVSTGETYKNKGNINKLQAWSFFNDESSLSLKAIESPQIRNKSLRSPQLKAMAFHSEKGPIANQKPYEQAFFAEKQYNMVTPKLSKSPSIEIKVL